MDTHPLHNLLSISMENLKEMIDVDKVIGNPIKSDDGTVIVPVSQVGVGYVSGGSEIAKGENQSYPFGGGNFGGIKVTPIAFLVIKDNDISLLHLESETHLYEKLLDLAPNLLNKILDKIPK